MNNEIDPSTSGLALYYTFNQGIAGGTNTGFATVIDQSGNNNGTLTNFSLTGSTSNFLAQNSGMTTLPLRWVSFTAQKRSDGVLLQWATASELGTSDFTIERSADAKEWKSIGSVIASNSEGNHHYSYIDNSPATGMNYYRIRQNDRDKKYSYSATRMVETSGKSASLRLVTNAVYSGILQIENRSLEMKTIFLYSSDGKLVLKKALTAGMNSIDISDKTKGVYLLKSEDQTERVLKE